MENTRNPAEAICERERQMTAKENYHIDDLVHDGEIYDALNRFDFDLGFYKKWCKKAGGKCLELCCGTGRLTIPLALDGIDIAGVDYTESMLKKAREKAATSGLNIGLFSQDMRKFNLSKLSPGKFSLIFIPFNSLQCIYELDDVEDIFRRGKAHLSDGGLFIIDIFNPSIKMMVERSEGWKECDDFITRDGRRVTIEEHCEYDDAGGVNRVTWKHTIDGAEVIKRLDMRCFWPREMEAILRYNGFELVHKFGNFDESEFKSGSPKQLYVLKAVPADKN